MKFTQSPVTAQLSQAIAILYMHAFESLGNMIDVLAQTLFTMQNKEGLAIDIMKVSNNAIF